MCQGVTFDKSSDGNREIVRSERDFTLISTHSATKLRTLSFEGRERADVLSNSA